MKINIGKATLAYQERQLHRNKYEKYSILKVGRPKFMMCGLL